MNLLLFLHLLSNFLMLAERSYRRDRDLYSGYHFQLTDAFANLRVIANEEIPLIELLLMKFSKGKASHFEINCFHATACFIKKSISATVPSTMFKAENCLKDQRIIIPEYDFTIIGCLSRHNLHK